MHVSEVSDVSNVSVLICGARCQCPICKARDVEMVASSPSPKSSHSATSLAAMGNTEAVSAARGGQKRQAQEAEPAAPAPPAAKVMKKPAARAARAPPAPPAPKQKFSITRRSQPEERKEAYIMMNGQYLVGLQKNLSAVHEHRGDSSGGVAERYFKANQEGGC